MMKVSAVSFTSAAGSGVSAKCKSKKSAQVCNNPYRLADIMPITVGLGAGLMLAYTLKTGKLDPVVRKFKGFSQIG